MLAADLGNKNDEIFSETQETSCNYQSNKVINLKDLAIKSNIINEYSFFNSNLND